MAKATCSPAISPSDELLYSIEEAAQLMSISKVKIYHLINVCDLGSVQIGRGKVF